MSCKSEGCVFVNDFVVIVPLREEAYEEALALLSKGPPFELEETEFTRNRAYATYSEIVFVFESPGPTATSRLAAENPSVWKVARPWRMGQTVFSRARGRDLEGVSYAATPGPGDSEGGDVFAP
jgi:hypothetical protein